MSFNNVLQRKGRLSQQKRDQLLEYANIVGVNYADSIYTMAENQSPYAKNVDFGDPIGCVTKRKGYESLITSLGTGKVLGLNNWQHSVGDKMLMAWGNDLYVLGGTVGSVAKSSDADWNAGTHNLTEASSGDIVLSNGTWTDATTATADFNSSHSNTAAASDKVSLVDDTVSQTVFITQSSATGTDATINSTTSQGQTITMPTGVTNVSSIQVGVDLVTASGDVTMTFYDGVAKSNTLGSAVVSITTTGTKTFAVGALGLTVGETYYFELTTASASINIKASDTSAYVDGARYLNGSVMTNDLTFWVYTATPKTGTYTHSVIDISSVPTEQAIKAAFNTTTPSGTSVTFEVALSNDSGVSYGAWTAYTSGELVVAAGVDKSTDRLKWRATLSTVVDSTSPSLDDVTLSLTYGTVGDWTSPVYDISNTPVTATMTYTKGTPANTTCNAYVRGSGNGTIFGDWQEILTSGDPIPLQRYLQVKVTLTSTDLTSTPTFSDFVISHNTGYTVANKLDISPLGRVDNLLSGNSVCFCNYEDWCLTTDGLRPFLLYITDDTQEVDTAQAGGASSITLKAGASAVNNFYNNAFITTTGGTGEGQTRWISGYVGATKVATVSAAWDTIPDATTTYSIGSAIKVRNLGVDPPTVAPSGVAGNSGNPNGAYKLMVTYVNADGVESNPSPASELVTVSGKMIVWTIPIDSSTGNTTAKRRLYRTAAGGTVYKYLKEVANNTSATYIDNRSDAVLGGLMLDNNNVPPSTCSLIFTFTSYVFYVTEHYYVRFSKAGAPDQCPYTETDIQEIAFPDEVTDMRSSPIALIFGGANFLASVTSNGGFIFDSDPTIDTTTMKLVDTHGGLSYRASAMCTSPNLKSALVVNTNVGLRSIIPGLQDNSVESVPFSKNMQKYYDRSINREQAAAVFYNNYYIYSFEYMAEDASESEHLTFAYDFRTEQWNGPWTFGMSAYTIQGNDLYAGDTANGKVYKMFTGNTDAGTAIVMECDMPMRAPGSEAGTCKFKRLMAIIHGDSTTTSTIIKPKVDEAECTVTLGTLATTFTGDERPGHDFIRTRKYGIGLPRGHTYSLRIVDDSVNPLRVMKIITEYEVLPLRN